MDWRLFFEIVIVAVFVFLPLCLLMFFYTKIEGWDIKTSSRADHIVRKLYEFYYPLRTHLGVVNTLAILLYTGKPRNFRILLHLLNPEQIYEKGEKYELSVTDIKLLNEIILVGRKIEELITTKGWLADDPSLVFHYIPDANGQGLEERRGEKLGLFGQVIAYFRALEMACKGEISDKTSYSTRFFYPHLLDHKINCRILDLQDNLCLASKETALTSFVQHVVSKLSLWYSNFSQRFTGVRGVIFRQIYFALALGVGPFLWYITDSLTLSLLASGVVVLNLFFRIWSEYSQTQVYSKGPLPLPIVINISIPANSQNALNALFDLIDHNQGLKSHQRNLAKYLQIQNSDLIFEYRRDIHNTDALKDFLKISRYRIDKLKSQTPQNTTIHLAYMGPASVGILVGTMFDTDGVQIFQYNKSSDSYYPTALIKDRSLKENIQKFEKFEVKLPQVTQERVTIAVDVASHKLKLSDPGLAEYGDLIYLSSKSDGTIAMNEDWIQYSREIFKTLSWAQQRYQEIRMIYSMPVLLSVILGMAVKNYWNIMLTNYDKGSGTYRDLMRTNEITYYF